MANEQPIPDEDSKGKIPATLRSRLFTEMQTWMKSESDGKQPSRIRLRWDFERDLRREEQRDDPFTALDGTPVEIVQKDDGPEIEFVA